jgi:DNA (cytosine-5)-methyltransferase 1
MRTVQFCEINPFCRRVLEQHWPHVPCHDDVRTLNQSLTTGIDLICGGFPCQDISVAGKSAGIDGEQSGLWREYAKLIELVRPRWVIIENSPRLRTLGADRVLSDLEKCGYTSTPLVVGAVHAGAPQIRKRAFIVAYAEGDGRGSRWPRGLAPSSEGLQDDAYIYGPADLHSVELREQSGRSGRTCWPEKVVPKISDTWQDGPFDGEPLDDGLPEDVDAAIKAYGNAVVPQLAELIGRAIMRAEHSALATERDP